MDDALLIRRSRLRLATISLGLLLVGLAGYFGFVVFVENDAIGGLGAGVMGLAVATGFAAFFSPCSFPLLLTFLSRQSEAGSSKRVLVSSLVVGLGAVTFFAVVALALVVVGEGLARVVGFDTLAGRLFRASIGVLLVFLGLRQASLIKVKMRVFDSVAASAADRFDPSRHENRTRRDFVYGFGYLLAGFG